MLKCLSLTNLGDKVLNLECKRTKYRTCQMTKCETCKRLRR